MITFVYQYNKLSPKVTIKLHPDSTLEEVIEAFEGFLRAATYLVDGELQIVKTNEDKIDE